MRGGMGGYHRREGILLAQKKKKRLRRTGGKRDRQRGTTDEKKKLYARKIKNERLSGRGESPQPGEDTVGTSWNVSTIAATKSMKSVCAREGEKKG